jgi:molybdopterin molybdotransferase
MAKSPLTPVDDVIERLLAEVQCLVGTELISVSQARGRILAQAVTSPINVPLLSNSAMDGYAVNTADVVKGGVLSVSDRIPAGTVGKTLQPGTAARIFTGAPIPQGANAVVIQEDTAEVDAGVEIHEVPRYEENIRRAGQDIVAGTQVLPSGHRLRPQDLGLVSSVGCADVCVFKKLKVAVMSTGDELIEPPATLQPGQIYNSNQYTLLALIDSLGMQSIDLGLVGDSPQATDAALRQGADMADCIVSTGGVSVGEEDHVKAAVERLGVLDIWRLAIKPGKPLAFGRVASKPFFGLPGNPVSTFVTFMMIARPYLLKSQGLSNIALPESYGAATFKVSAGSRREYLRVRLSYDEAGICRVESFENQGSGVMSSVCWATGLAQVEPGQTIEVGDQLKVHIFTNE